MNIQGIMLSEIDIYGIQINQTQTHITKQIGGYQRQGVGGERA